MATKDYEYLRRFCETDKQRYYLDLIRDNATIRQAAREAGIAERNMMKLLDRLRKRATAAGVVPENPLVKEMPARAATEGDFRTGRRRRRDQTSVAQI